MVQPDPNLDQMKRVMGESRNFYDLVSTFASKSLWFTCFMVYKLWDVALATMESHAMFAAWMISLATVVVVTFVVCGTVKKVSAAKYLNQR